ncbi:MAG TPA: arylsulfatase [Candidatus Paceibacterota bacterium]|nr:arylsulfatase [Verrucomicrobiota bacterium]HSA09259.1 arylsulfatase [Candidatus Paceibacterota bacterium]
MKVFRLVSVVLVAGFALLSVASFAADVRPNVLFFLADDLGYADVGFTGSKEIKTPHLDTLAAAGARLEQFYVQPLCSPTRAALMTGRYPMRYGMQVGVIKPWEHRGLSLEERLLPKVLQDAGYTTAIVGKWHLGCYERAYLPTSRGFVHQYGHYCGALDYFTHVRDDGFDWHRDDRVCRDEGYSTHLIAREAQRLLREQPADKPFFLYVPFNAVHSPHQVPEKYCAPYASFPEPRRTYAGMVAAMDEAIGQVLATLDARGFRTNTLIFFSSDNGGPAPGRVTSNGPLRSGKGTVYEGGTRVCACVAWTGRIKAGAAISQPLHMVDWYPTLLKLAGASLEQKLPLDGRDILGVLTQGKPSPHDQILLNTTPRGGAIRVGDWKLIVNGVVGVGEEDVSPPPAKRKKAARKDQPRGVELFNLAQDPSEQRNLAAEQPDKVKELRARYDALARQAVAPGNQPQTADYKAPRIWGEKD